MSMEMARKVISIRMKGEEPLGNVLRGKNFKKKMEINFYTTNVAQ